MASAGKLPQAGEGASPAEQGEMDQFLAQLVRDWLEAEPNGTDDLQLAMDETLALEAFEEDGMAAPAQASSDPVVKRRERNKIFAREIRQRKKCSQEALHSRMVDLAAENRMLKALIKEKLSGSAQEEVLSQCVPYNMPPEASSCATIALDLLEKGDYGLIRSIQSGQRSYLITDPKLPDNPIVYASPQFLDLTGYSLGEVIGRNCRFLQGSATDPRAIERLREDIQKGVDTCVCLINYRRDGSTFVNQVFVTPLRNAEGQIVYYVGVQVKVALPTVPATKKSPSKRSRSDRPERFDGPPHSTTQL